MLILFDMSFDKKNNRKRKCFINFDISCVYKTQNIIINVYIGRLHLCASCYNKRIYMGCGLPIQKMFFIRVIDIILCVYV